MNAGFKVLPISKGEVRDDSRQQGKEILQNAQSRRDVIARAVNRA
jgi:hypothetical protein